MYSAQASIIAQWDYENVAQPDICVIGGGPAGLTAAIALRLTGASVLVLDTNTPPIDKACGEGLMPDTLKGLREVGVQVPASEGYIFRGVRFVRDQSEAQADFPSGHGIGLRRTVLHRVLVERACEAGVELQWAAKSVGVTHGTVSISGAVLKPKLIVGADGQNSRVRQAAGLHHVTRSRQRYGFRRHYGIAPWTPYVEVHWGKRCQIYVTPISPHEVGVALLTSDPRQRLDSALQLFPRLAERLASVQRTSSERGAITAMRTLRNVHGRGVALVGDASGSVDAITGEGVGLAVRQAAALAQAFQSNGLERYAQAHRRIKLRPAVMAELLLCLSDLEALQHPVMTALARFPRLFERMLGLHVGDYASGAETVTGAGIPSRPKPERLKSQS